MKKMKVYGDLPYYKTLHLACPTRNEVIRLRSVDLGTMPNKIKHKSLEEWCQSTRWNSCRNLRYSNPRCFDRTKNVCLFIEWSTKLHN